MDSLRAGYCEVPNPFDSRRVRRIELDPASVGCIVFWTRDPRPLAARARELEGPGVPLLRPRHDHGLPRGPRAGRPTRPPRPSPRSPPSPDAIGSERALWRYDPILLARELPPEWHRRNFELLSAALEGRTRRVTLSLLDEYARTMGRLERAGYHEVVFGSPRAAPARVRSGGPAPRLGGS